MPSNMDVELSKYLAKLVKAKKSKCFDNSILALTVFTAYKNGKKQFIKDEIKKLDAWYCEGFFNPVRGLSDLWIPHAWVVIGDKLIDVTCHDQLAQAATYKEVKRFSFDEVSDWQEREILFYPISFSFSDETRCGYKKKEAELFWEASQMMKGI